MGRTDTAGFGIALVGHAAVIAALILFYDRADPALEPPAMEVSFLEEVGPVSSAPETAEAPAPSFGEELGAPEEASGAVAPVPDPVTAPVPEPVRPPVQAGERRRPDLTRNPVQTRPAPPPRVAQAQPQRPQPRQGQGQAQRSAGLDLNALRRSLNPEPQARGTSPAAPAQLTGAQRQRISSQIGGLIQPCASRAQPPNGFARSISVVLRVTVTPNGTPTNHQLVSSSGTSSTNEDYVDDVVGVAMRAVRACSSRIATLPSEYYQNGWRTFQYRFRFP